MGGTVGFVRKMKAAGKRKVKREETLGVSAETQAVTACSVDVKRVVV